MHRIHLEPLVRNNRTSPQWLEPEERGNPLVMQHKQFNSEEIMLVNACKKDPRMQQVDISTSTIRFKDHKFTWTGRERPANDKHIY